MKYGKSVFHSSAAHDNTYALLATICTCTSTHMHGTMSIMIFSSPESINLANFLDQVCLCLGGDGSTTLRSRFS